MTLRIVLDTNVVLSALMFSSGRLVWLRQAWRERQLVPLVCKETLDELLRVLAYPKFGLSVPQQKALLVDFLLFVEVIDLPPLWPELPTCRDEGDQVFLVLAHVGEADALVTGDTDLLSLRDLFRVPILTAEELAGRVSNRIHEMRPGLYAVAAP